MTTQTCHTCHTEIPAGLAVQRSVGLFVSPHAWCRSCWDLRLAVEAVFVPEQRRASERVDRCIR